MNNKKDNHCVDARKKVRDDIAGHVEEFLSHGGKIEVLGSPFDKQQDSKYRAGSGASFFN